MSEEIMNFELPVARSSIIKVIGVGGGGGNAVNYMHRLGIKDVNFVVCNTDAQALANSPVAVKIHLGKNLTEGRGAGNNPDIGRKAATESLDEINDILASNTKMIFITAGMGGGTGTGASPVIAKAAREMGILTVAIITIPFPFEGSQRINQAIDGINELREYVDSLLVINNGRLRELYGNLKISDAFGRADDVLSAAAKGIAEIITRPGYVNVDFADVQTVMSNSGVAIMGSGTASGSERALVAIQEALKSPLLNNNDIRGAKNILLNITSGDEEITMDEVGTITDFVTSSVARNTNIIWGTCSDPSLGELISVTIIATGFDATTSIPELYNRKKNTQHVQLPEQHTNARPVSPVFVVEKKNDTPGTGDELLQFTEKTVDPRDQKQFTLFDPGADENSHSSASARKATERVNLLKKAALEKEKEAGMSASEKSDSIDKLENQPAYLRKKVDIKKQNPSNDGIISRFTLSDEGDKGIVLRPDNPYLHDNVD
jgi:cell division protein FtsZ